MFSDKLKNPVDLFQQDHHKTFRDAFNQTGFFQFESNTTQPLKALSEDLKQELPFLCSHQERIL